MTNKMQQINDNQLDMIEIGRERGNERGRKLSKLLEGNEEFMINSKSRYKSCFRKPEALQRQRPLPEKVCECPDNSA